MGRGKKLNESEKNQILKLKEQKLSVSKISTVIKRSRKVIHNFLKNVEDYGKKKSSGRPSSLSDRDKRSILRAASNSLLTTKQIMGKCGISASVSSVRRVLLCSKNIKRLKLKKKPPLTTKHKAERLRFAKEKIHWKKKWRKILFSDEKKFNLDGPDGFQYYFHDVRKETMSAVRRQMGGGSAMVWAGIGYFGKTNIKFIDGRMNSARYIKLIEEQINDHAVRISGPDYIFQQDNAPIHTSKLAQSYFDENNISVLPWPARSPDINIIENCWAQLVRGVYGNGKQYEHVQELKNAIVREWDKLSENYIQKLYKSMPDRMVEIIENKGGCTHY